MEDKYIRLSHEGLMDLQRTLLEANKERLHQQVEEQHHLIHAINRTDATGLLTEIKNKLEENNTALRILATQTNKLLDDINRQTEEFARQTTLLEKSLSQDNIPTPTPNTNNLK